MSKNQLSSVNTNYTYFERDSAKNTQTKYGEDYEIWFNEKEKLEYVRLRPEGLRKLANLYQTRTDKPQTSSISVVEFKTESEEFSFNRRDHPDYLEELKKELKKVVDDLGDGKTQGMLFCITGKNGNSIHTIPFLIQKDKSSTIKILDFENHLRENSEDHNIVINKVTNYPDVQKSHHGCGTFALDIIRNCLEDNLFLVALSQNTATVTLPKMVLEQDREYNSKLSADKKSKYVSGDFNRKSLYKSHQYAQLLNPDHLKSLEKIETLELILKAFRAQTRAKSEPLSFDQWLKQKWGVIEKNENTSAEATGKIALYDGQRKKIPVVNYCFESDGNEKNKFNEANRFASFFKIKSLTSTRFNREPVFTDNVSGEKHAVAVTPEYLEKIDKAYKDYQKKFLNTGTLTSLLEQQIKLLNDAREILRNFAIRERVTLTHEISIGEKNGVFPHDSLSAYKAMLDAYIALNYQKLSDSEISELNKRSGWLFGYDKANYGSASFTGLKADANFLNVIGGNQCGLYATGAKSNKDSIESAAKYDADCQVDGVGRCSSKKRSAPGFSDFHINTVLIEADTDRHKWKVVPRMVVGKTETETGSGVLIPETNRILIEGGGMRLHSYTVEYWWKAKTANGHEIETKRFVDNEFLLGKDCSSDVKGAEVLLWKIPDKDFWIKKEDYGVETFFAVDESGKFISPQPNKEEIDECIEVLQSAKYDYYRTEYNGGAGLHWDKKQSINNEGRQTSGQAWIPYTVKIEPRQKSIAEDIKERIVAERMSKLYEPTQEFLAGSNPNDPAVTSVTSSGGDPEWKKWHDVIEPLDENQNPFDKKVDEYSRKMAIQHSGNCAEINKFYTLLGVEKSSVDSILQEFRNTFVKAKNGDSILRDIDTKLHDISSQLNDIHSSQKEEQSFVDIKMQNQEKTINDRINELKSSEERKDENVASEITKVLPIIDLETFPQKNAAEEFEKLKENHKRKILEGTRITVTQEEIEHAKRFIALVAITEGEAGRGVNLKEISQKEVYKKQGILPHNYLQGYEEGLLEKKINEKKINFVATKITPENIRAFYKRLIEKRPKAFYGSNDAITDRVDFPRYINGDLNLPEYVGYSEIEFGAMLQVFGATQFINDGGRGNQGKKSNQGKKRVDDQVANAGNSGNGYVSGAHEKFGYISAIVGMRLETPDPAMERLHVIEGEREKAIQQYNSSKGTNEKGDFARMRNVKIDFVEGHQLIWDQFYKQNSQQKGGSSTEAGVAFNDEVAKQRLYISYKKFLAESIANAQQDEKKAHIRITGCGDGVWANNQGAKVKSAIGKAVRKAFDELKQKSQISAIEFCEFVGTAYYTAFTENPPDKEKPFDDVKIVSSGAKFSDELTEDEKKSGDKETALETVLCVNFAWDGGSYVGNEYWDGLLSASGDPAAACCSSIAISMNPEINPQFLDKLFVVSTDGTVSEVGGESSTIKVTSESTEQETQTIKIKQPKHLYSEKEWMKKYGYIAKREDGLKNDVAKILTENITSAEQANNLLRDVQESITLLDGGRGDADASFLQRDFKRNRVSDSVQEVFFEEREGEVSFKNASFKKGTPNIDALTNVSYLLTRHAELVDPHKNLAKKLIKYQLQEIQKIKEGSTDKEKSNNLKEKAYKIKTLRNLAVYLGASDNPGHLVIGDGHEDASEFVNLLCDALYENPPFRLEKTSIAVDYEEYRSVKNDPATTLQTELPEAIIKDGKRVFEKTSFQETINAHQKAEILGEELNEDRYRKELQSKYNRTGPKVDFEEFYKSHVESGDLEKYLKSADVVFDTEEGKKKFKTQSQIKAFVSSDVSEIVVSSKRFAFTQEGQGYKLENEVSLDPIIFSVDGGGEGDTKTFYPTAFIQHNGYLQGGHYISYVKESDNNWYCYDDKNRSGPTEESELIQAQKDSYIVKYSVEGTKLPEAQVGANNLTGNMCWANATAALMASCSSLLNDKIILTKEEQGILDGDFAREISPAKGASRNLLKLSNDIKEVITRSSFEEPEGSYLDDKTLEKTEVDLLKSPDKDEQKSIQAKEFKKILEHHQKLIENKKLQVINPGGNNISDPMNGKPYDPDHFKNYQGDTKNTYLMWEIAMGYNDFVSDFLDFSNQHSLDIGLDSQASGFFNNTALHIAVAKGYSDRDGLGLKLETSNLQLVSKLIDLGADPNIINTQSENTHNDLKLKNCTPLDLAVARGDIDMVIKILASQKMKESTVKQARERAENDFNLSQEAVSGALTFPSSSGYKVFAEINEDQYQENKETISALLQSKLEELQILKVDQIEEKIFVNPEQGGENLSAEDVAIRKFVGNNKKLVEEMRKKWSKKNPTEEESILKYAAKGVLNKAIDAKNKLDNNSEHTVEKDWGQKNSDQWKKQSQKVWNSRCVRTHFKSVDLSGTFRTVFVNCIFDENCVLPTDKSSIDQKYFSKCKISKKLMDKEENKELKAALKITEENGDFYEVSEMKREKYGEKDKKGNPNQSFKPIESFQLIKDFKLLKRG